MVFAVVASHRGGSAALRGIAADSGYTAAQDRKQLLTLAVMWHLPALLDMLLPMPLFLLVI